MVFTNASCHYSVVIRHYYDVCGIDWLDVTKLPVFMYRHHLLGICISTQHNYAARGYWRKRQRQQPEQLIRRVNLTFRRIEMILPLLNHL
jgi:hypothetical protein